MKNGHTKSCKSCTGLSSLWLAQKIMKNDVWYMGVTSQFQAQAHTLISKGKQSKVEKHAFPHFSTLFSLMISDKPIIWTI